VNLEKNDPAKQFMEVEKTFVHENYTETPEALYSDIGQSFTLNQFINRLSVRPYLMVLCLRHQSTYPNPILTSIPVL